MFTVKDFLDSKIVPWYQILSGGDAIKNIPINYISVIELPVGDFIRENELVLSTALGCKNDPELLLELIQDVHKAKASALLISMQSDNITLPPQVAEYLSEHDFPLILIPWHSRFADITEAVLNNIRNDVVTEIAFYEDAQKRLLSAYLENSNINHAAQILADIFESNVIMFDTGGHAKASSKAFRHSNEEELQNCFGDDSHIMEIKTNERLYGNLYLKSNNNIIFNEILFQRYLVWGLILWFDKEWVIQSTRQNTRDNFVWKLTRDSSDTHEELSDKAEFLGFNLRDSYLCIVGKINLRNAKAAKNIDRWIASNLSPLKEEIIETSHLIHRQIMATYQQKLLIIYLQSSVGEQSSSGADYFLDRLEKRIESIFPQIYFTWGISNPGGEPTNFRECFLDAKLALELCLNSPSQNNRFAFKDTIIYKALSLLAADDGIKAKTDTIIKPLVEYDKQNKSELIKTLQTYLSLKNVSEAARHLHLHRQTLLYQINKIEELTGMSLKNADDFFLLEFCVRLFSDLTG